MNATIRLFGKVIPKVQTIDVVSGVVVDTTYIRSGSKWTAYDHQRVK